MASLSAVLLRAPLVVLSLAVIAFGCGLGDADEEARIDVFTTHHAAPLPSGEIPTYGAPTAARTWVNDMGWEVNLTEGYIVVRGLRLVECDDTKHEVPFAYGPFPDYLNAQDLDVVPMGGVDTPVGTYCSVIVNYGPYRFADTQGTPKGPYPLPTDRDLEGTTIFLAGIARLGDQTVPFEFRSSEDRIVELEIREADGVPTEYRVEAGVGALKVTLGKTYDPFFNGIDFSAFDPMMINAGLMDHLVMQSRAYRGTTIY
ncbi:MAG: hypothetical protein R3B09_33675 [Nannocystaceae bacterium]